MDPQEKELSEKRKRNMQLTIIHKALTYDLLFFYGIIYWTEKRFGHWYN